LPATTDPPASPPAPGDARHRLSETVRTLGFVSLLNDTAGDMIHPLLPAFIAVLGGGPEILGLIEGVADAASSLVQILSGYAADRIRRLKALTVAGYTLANVLRPMLAIAGTWWEVLIIRFGDRAGKGVRTAPRDALLAHATASSSRGRAYGFHRAMDNAGALLGPALAYAMLWRGFSMRMVFACAAIPGALAVMLLIVAVRELPAQQPSQPVQIGLPASAEYRRFLLAIFVFTLGCSSDSFLLWRAAEVGVPIEYAPLLWMLLALVKAATSTWGGTMSDIAGRRKLILAGWTIYAAVYVGFAIASAHWQIWALFAIYGTFYGLTEGPEKALVVDLVREEWRGRALGAYHAVVGAASLPASLMFGVVYQSGGAHAAFAMGAALAAVAAALLPRHLPAAKGTSPVS
jgi:MFS family permease